MKRPNSRYKRQTLALFFIVSLIPALVVAAIWYLQTSLADVASLTVNFSSFVLPVMLLGIIPALLLSYLFAELLNRPVHAVNLAVKKLADGKFLSPADIRTSGELGEINRALLLLSAKLEQGLSEAASESALIEAERNKLRGVLNSMTDGVFALDSAGRIILFNHAAAALTGRSIAEAAGQLAEKIIPLRQNGELVMTRWLATERGNDHKIGQWKGLELYRADGSSLFVDVQAVVLPNDPNGINALITFHDVTAGQQLEQMKVDFVALAAHELRTPLTQARGYLDILQHELKRPSKETAFLISQSIASTGVLSNLVNNLLNVARIEHGELNYDPVALDYHKFLLELQPVLDSQFFHDGRKLTLNVPARLPKLVADPMGLREVLTNLISNAATHVAAGTGHVEITVHIIPGALETIISDNGTGIPTAAMPHLFTKFYRVDELTASSGGTGLGLFICRSIIELHGGTIAAESKLGQGSAFNFRIPLPVADDLKRAHNRITTGGAHGWIKDNSVR